MWYLYLVRCRDGSLYTGISTDVTRRLESHTANRGARRLRGRGPLELVFSRAIGDRSAAQRAEYRVKQMSRQQKEQLLRGERDLPPFDSIGCDDETQSVT
jgi:putative endonuclease